MLPKNQQIEMVLHIPNSPTSLGENHDRKTITKKATALLSAN